jgi:hypothetical protein
MTNLVYKCETNSEVGPHFPPLAPTQPHRKSTFLVLSPPQACKLVALARVHASEDQLFERESELAAFVAVGKSGLGPKLLGLFGNGRIEEFLIDHDTLSASDIHDAVMSPAVAEAMANFHFLLVRACAWSFCHLRCSCRFCCRPCCHCLVGCTDRRHAGAPRAVQTQQMSRAQDGAEGQAPAAHPIVWSRIRHWLELTHRVWGDAASELDLGDIAQEVCLCKRSQIVTRAPDSTS